MQKNVGEHAQSAIARRLVVLVAEDRGIDLGLGRILEAFDLLFGFGWDVGLERLDVAGNLSFDAVEQADLAAVLSVFFFSHSVL
jgi:hypothetical protein